LLPKETANVVGWVAAALDHLHDRDLDRYPAHPGWEGHWAWRTPTERRLLTKIDAVKAERALLVERLAHEERRRKWSWRMSGRPLTTMSWHC